MEKMPPVEKIVEAYSAIADGRVEMREDAAEIRSSNGAKTYVVRWEGNLYRSSDSATYWQGYPGYPVLAVLMLQGKLPYSAATAAHFKGVPWAALNKRHKRNYAAATAEVLGALAKEGVDTDALQKEVRHMFGELEKLDIHVGRTRGAPAKENKG